MIAIRRQTPDKDDTMKILGLVAALGCVVTLTAAIATTPAHIGPAPGIVALR
jgi:hypothetical protein